MKALTLTPKNLEERIRKTIARYLDEGFIANGKVTGDYRLHSGLATDMDVLGEKMAAAVLTSVQEFQAAPPAAASAVVDGRMKIERTHLLELDVVAERERIARNFKGRERQLLLELLEAFISLEWERAHQILSTMPREQLEYLHPVLYETMRGRIERNNLRQAAGKRQVKVSPSETLMGGTNGGIVSRDGLDYPKFKVGEHVL